VVSSHDEDTKQNPVAFSPQANYADCPTATCQRNLVPTFADRRVSRGQTLLYVDDVRTSLETHGPLER
jgi:hypothetical protein